MDSAQQDMIATNALNAAQTAFCLQPENRGKVVYLVVRIVDTSGLILAQKMSDVGLDCHQ